MSKIKDLLAEAENIDDLMPIKGTEGENNEIQL